MGFGVQFMEDHAEVGFGPVDQGECMFDCLSGGVDVEHQKAVGVLVVDLSFCDLHDVVVARAGGVDLEDLSEVCCLGMFVHHSIDAGYLLSVVLLVEFDHAFVKEVEDRGMCLLDACELVIPDDDESVLLFPFFEH